jgi:acetylornithine deacetylase/succinyl-diaminopimelate desuccinylase-like protein
VTDLLALTAELVDIPSESHDERAIADRIEADLRGKPWLTVERIDDNVIARTTLDRPLRSGRRWRARSRHEPRGTGRRRHVRLLRV